MTRPDSQPPSPTLRSRAESARDAALSQSQCCAKNAHQPSPTLFGSLEVRSWNLCAVTSAIVIVATSACGATRVEGPRPESVAVSPPPIPSPGESVVHPGPKVGGTCTAADRLACKDDHAALFCLGGTFTEMRCDGPRGCAPSGHGIQCDNTVARVGDGCAEEEDLACTLDGKAELRCRANKFVVASTCRGPTGCFFVHNTKLHCDTDLADLPDPCEDNGDLACALDGRALYKCNGTQYSVESSCKGPNGCRIAGTSVRCDHHVADLDDACHRDGNFACSADAQAILVCRSGKFVTQKACKKECSFVVRGDTTEFDCP
jgi:hypothetical protein